jgi:tetratricopeptide (TPR) repeat protein
MTAVAAPCALRYIRDVRLNRVWSGGTVAARPGASPLAALAFAIGFASAATAAAATAPLAAATPAAAAATPSSASSPSAHDSFPSSIYFPHAPRAADTSLAAEAQRARDKYALGRALERAHEPAAAIAAYRAATSLDPSIPEANYRMGMLFLTVNQLRPAAECFVQEVIHHPSHTDAARELGITYARLGEADKAVLQLEPLTRSNPRDAASWAALGFAYMSAKRTAAADSAFRRALALEPKNASWHRDHGAVLAAEGRSAEARREYQLAQQLDPKDANAWVNLANLERREGHLEAALADYRQAEARDTLSPLALEGQVQTLRQLKRDREAGEVYRRWLRRRPDDHEARLDAVRLWDDLGRNDVSLEIARDGVRANPESPDARLILGMALQSNGDWRRGLAELRTAERKFTTEEDRARVNALIAVMRHSAPDSLRAWFTADSVAHASPLDSPAGRTRGRR